MASLNVFVVDGALVLRKNLLLNTKKNGVKMVEYQWNEASLFPTPGIPLKVKLDNGEIVDAIRPRYVDSYTVDPEYQTVDGVPIVVVEWMYK